MTPTHEQYELAAQAAGKSVWFDQKGLCRGTTSSKDLFDAPYWKPVTDKSDSFDLMVACGIRPYWTNSEFFDGSDYCAATTKHLESGIVLYKDHNNDKGPATVRAVFLCAVEIGRSL